MSMILNPYIGGGGNIVSSWYPVAGSPNPALGDSNGITSVTTTTGSASSDTSSYGGVAQDGWNGSTSTGAVDGAVLNHTDEDQYLYGYFIAFTSSNAAALMEIALYDVTAGFTSPTIVEGSRLSITVPTANKWRQFLLPAPIQLATGKKYALARSSGDWSSTSTLTFYSFQGSANLPSNSGYGKQLTHPLPTVWPTAASINVEGPYFFKTIMGPLMTGPAVALVNKARTTFTGITTQAVTVNVTLTQAMSGNRAVVVQASIVGNSFNANFSTITSMKLNGVEGLQLYKAGDVQRVGCSGFWPASLALAAGTYPVVITFASTPGSAYAGDVELFELNNCNQDPEVHHYDGVYSASGGNEARACAPTTRPYDGVLVTCRGGTQSTIYRPVVNVAAGVIAKHLEWCLNGLTNGEVLSMMGVIPVSNDTNQVYYGMGGTGSAQTMLIFMPARA